MRRPLSRLPQIISIYNNKYCLKISRLSSSTHSVFDTELQGLAVKHTMFHMKHQDLSLYQKLVENAKSKENKT